ncbi:MAG: aromatic amino acid transaminase [Caulobacterales bacterium]|jgi:aromatic-amino-acid transaminase
MFSAAQAVKPDAIIALMEEFRADPRPTKLDLGVGVYRDETGRTPVFTAVQKAQATLVAQEQTKEYVGVGGDKDFCTLIGEMVFGPGLLGGRVSVVQSVGGTGAIRLLLDTIAPLLQNKTLYVPDPTWPNHYSLAKGAGLACVAYPHFDANLQMLRIDGLLAFLRERAAGDAVLFHGCCHNPTGMDPTDDQWRAIVDVVADRGIFPVVDLAYHGMGRGLSEDAFLPHHLAARGIEFALSYSCSKNFGLYRDRVGAAMFVCADQPAAAAAKGLAMNAARATYSMPPHHGANIVKTILQTPDLRAEWQKELDAMRDRIVTLRNGLATALATKTNQAHFEAINRQAGMFSFLNLSNAEVEALKTQYAIYAVGGGRVNLAGLRTDAIDPVAEAIATLVAARPQF